MTTHANLYCDALDRLSRDEAINAIFQAHTQLKALGPEIEVDGVTFDNRPALQALWACLKAAGYAGARNG